MALQRDVLASLQPFIHHLSLLIRTNQLSDLPSLLARPDVQQVLGVGVSQAAGHAADAVSQAWPGPQTAYATHLFEDVTSSWSDAPGELASAAQRAFASVPQGRFVVGVTPPGTNPVVETANARAQAVASALHQAAGTIAMRSQLSADVAGTRAAAEAVLAEAAEREAAGEVIEKEWVAVIDHRTCAWCRALHGVRVGLHEDFPHGAPVAVPRAHREPGRVTGGQSHPPAVYLNLAGPPRHPRCRCTIRLVAAGGPGVPEPVAVPAHYVSSETIKAMSDEHYQALRGFIRAALHELAMILRRLLGIR